MVKSVVGLLLMAAPAAASDDFNCPPPAGNIMLDDEALNQAFPSHIDRILPPNLIVDFSCKVNDQGRFVDCTFAPRENLSDKQIRIVKELMPRFMDAISTDVPNQACISSKIELTQPAPENSKPSPDEPAR